METSGVELEFQIKAYQPASMPISRLAEYMVDLAKLLGCDDAVHFVRLNKGSTTIVHEVEPQHFPMFALGSAARPNRILLTTSGSHSGGLKND